MGFNLGTALASGVQGFMTTGNPWAAAGEAAIGGFAGGAGVGGITAGNTVGALGNGGLGALDASDEAFQLAMYGEQIRHQETMQVQSEAFDEMMDEKSEQIPAYPSNTFCHRLRMTTHAGYRLGAAAQETPESQGGKPRDAPTPNPTPPRRGPLHHVRSEPGQGGALNLR